MDNKAVFDEEEDDFSEFEKLLEGEDNFLSDRKFRFGEEIRGVVASISPDSLFLDVGTKKLGIIAKDEFLSAGLSVPEKGQEITLFVKEDTGSELHLSRGLKQKDSDIGQLKEVFRSGLPIEATVEAVSTGGYTAKVGKMRAFIPFSQMSLMRVSEPEEFIGKTFLFNIIELRAPKNLVLSRRKLLEQEKTQGLQETLDSLKEGDMRRVKITRLMDFGAFASLGAIEGLIPISELSWKRIKHPKEAVSEGDEVQVKILSIDVSESSKKPKIALSLKQALEDPWALHGYRLTPGALFEAKITHTVQTGAFAVLEQEGLEGFIPIHELSEARIKSPLDVVKIGDIVEVRVLDATPATKRLSLSLKKNKRVLSESSGEEKDWKDYLKNQSVRQDSSSLAFAFSKANNKKK